MKRIAVRMLEEERREQLARIQQILWQYFRYRIGEQEEARFMDKGTFCPGVAAKIGEEKKEKKKAPK